MTYGHRGIVTNALDGTGLNNVTEPTRVRQSRTLIFFIFGCLFERYALQAPLV